ncbi:arylsulfatase [Bacteroidota bacterium]
MKNTAVISILLLFMAGSLSAQGTNPPNVILILADDQGIGDVGFNGNPLIKTPLLDQLALESTQFTNFYVSPVCAPTRASLMTGMYAQKTGIYDTYNGGAIMAEEEITIAEVLSQHKYACGIFGKWHLGDNYPFRPIDQGFSESLVHKAGGIGQPGDPDNFFAGDSAYFNPVLWKNGNRIQTQGYCSDVFTEAAIRFLREYGDNPFFLYLSFNAPHTPLQVPDSYYKMYENLTLNELQQHSGDNSMQLDSSDLEDAKRVYGMVSNIDDNLKRFFGELESMNLMDNTVIIYLSDNGPQQHRYRMGLRGKKSDVYEGGIRVPFLIRYPDLFKKGYRIRTPAAHIDLFPTIMDICGIPGDSHKNTDGKSLLPLIKGEEGMFRQRPLFWEWGRGYPVLYRNIAVLRGNYKLIGNCGHDAEIEAFEVYDLKEDPYETNNLILEKTELASSLKLLFDEWFDETLADRDNRKIHRIQVGTDAENPVLLNRNDAKGITGAWKQQDAPYHWDIEITDDGYYHLSVKFLKEIREEGRLFVRLYPHNFMIDNTITSDELQMGGIHLTKGDFRLEVFYRSKSGELIFPLYTSLERISE